MGTGANEGARDFPPTRWSLIVRADATATEQRDEAVAELCQIYHQPVYTFALRTGHRPVDAMDLTQGFFAQFLRKEAFAKADAERGRLRTFLLTSFRNFVLAQHQRETAEKRGGNQGPVSLDEEHENGWNFYDKSPDDGLTPDEAFDRAFASALVDHAMSKLEKEYSSAGKSRQFECLAGFLKGEQDGESYAAAGEKLGMSEGAARAAAHRMRLRFREIFRDAVTQTLADPSHADDEIRSLKAAMGA